MPLIIVTRNQTIITDHVLPKLARTLQEVVADRLNVDEEGGDLTPEVIEVRFREPGPHDVNYSNLMIEIFANWFPTRAENVITRTDLIGDDLRASNILPSQVFGSNNFVWVFLGHAGFSLL